MGLWTRGDTNSINLLNRPMPEIISNRAGKAIQSVGKSLFVLSTGINSSTMARHRPHVLFDYSRQYSVPLIVFKRVETGIK